MAAAPKPMRNWAAMDPLMRKGGAHQPPKKQTRPKLDWRNALDDFDDWRDSDADDNTEADNEGAKVPSFFWFIADFRESPPFRRSVAGGAISDQDRKMFSPLGSLKPRIGSGCQNLHSAI